VLAEFFNWNRRVCEWIEEHVLPVGFTRSFNRAYEAVMEDAMAERPDQSVLDIGGGKKCFVAGLRKPECNTRIVALDVDEDELRLNEDVDARLVGDATRALPFGRNSFDIVTSRSLLEHLADTGAFIRDAERVLKPGGRFIHLCPGKFAPFAMFNHMLPDAVARRLLYAFHPNFEAECGFKAFYDGTYPSAMARKLESSGFEIVEIRRRYYQSIYYNFFVPLYLVFVLYDLAVYALGIRDLAAQLLIIARKKGA